MATRMLELLPATGLIVAADMAGVEYTEDHWRADLDTVNNNKAFVIEVLPLLQSI
jgi:hypothetical protein